MSELGGTTEYITTGQWIALYVSWVDNNKWIQYLYVASGYNNRQVCFGVRNLRGSVMIVYQNCVQARATLNEQPFQPISGNFLTATRRARTTVAAVAVAKVGRGLTLVLDTMAKL